MPDTDYATHDRAVRWPGLELRHIPHKGDDDVKDCAWCVLAGDENAHTMRDYLPVGLSFMQGDLDRRAVCSPAEITEGELVCWCGHSLHLSTCPDGGDCHDEESPNFGWCRRSWVERAYRPWGGEGKPGNLNPPPIYACPNEGQEHRPRLAVETDGRHCMVWCRDCMVIVEIDMAVGKLTDVTDRG